jgi:hypothetical protein
MGEEGTVVRVVERGMSGGWEKRREGFTVGKGGMVRGGERGLEVGKVKGRKKREEFRVEKVVMVVERGRIGGGEG